MTWERFPWKTKRDMIIGAARYSSRRLNDRAMYVSVGSTLSKTVHCFACINHARQFFLKFGDRILYLIAWNLRSIVNKI